MTCRSAVTAAVLMLLAAAVPATAAPFSVDSIGISRMTSVKHFDGLSETSLRLRTRLQVPDWTWLRRAGLSLSLEGRGGQFRRDGRTAAHVGTSLVAGWRVTGAYGTIWVELGTGPGWIERRRFGGEDLGGPLQFTSHAGIGIRPVFLPRLGISLRIQHISNARLYRINPGVDMVGITARWYPGRPRTRSRPRLPRAGRRE